MHASLFRYCIKEFDRAGKSRSAGVSASGLLTCAAYGGGIREPRDARGCAYQGVDRFLAAVLRRAGSAGGDASTPVNLLFVHVTHCFSGEGHARLLPVLDPSRRGSRIAGPRCRRRSLSRRRDYSLGDVTDSPKRAKRHPNPGGDSPSVERELG